MPARTIAFLTTETGEKYRVLESRQPEQGYNRMFHTSFDEAVARIAKTIKQGLALRLFLILPSHLSYTHCRSPRGSADRNETGTVIDGLARMNETSGFDR